MPITQSQRSEAIEHEVNPINEHTDKDAIRRSSPAYP